MPNEDWMAGFTNRQDLTLADVTIPVSHDAGLSEAPGCYIPYTSSMGRNQTICQYVDVAGQLSAGSRGFDIRIGVNSGVVRTFHGEGVGGGALGGWGQTANSIFQQINTFLSNHAGEIVITRISHTEESAGAHRAVLANIHPDRLLRCGPRNIATIPLHQLRGKCIAIFDKKALAQTDPYSGLHRFIKHPNTNNEGGLTICGKYAGWLANLKDMSKKAIKCGNDHGTHPFLGRAHDHLYMIYWQIAAMAPTSSVKTFTVTGQDERIKTMVRLVEEKGSHYNLDYILNLHRGDGVSPVGGERGNVTPQTRNRFRPNIINLDFVNDISVGKVLEFNSDLMI